MHPAYSVILFTSSSGAGYGLLVWLVFCRFGWLEPLLPETVMLAGVLALVLVTVGLLASTFHLGHPERAWRAFSQWRSSWLSREGVLAVASYPIALLFLSGMVWGRPAFAAGLLPAMAMMAVAAATVCSTGMIYASLKAIPRWHNAWVVPVYLFFSLGSGGLLFGLLATLSGSQVPWLEVSVLLVVSWMAKLGYWRFIDGQRVSSTTGTATGLGNLGIVRQLEAPHTSENYLMQEMGFRVARKHASRLRRLGLLFGMVLPLALTGLTWGLNGLLPAWLAALSWVLATASGLLGILVERWLFFAEARHLVTLYYGRPV